jgi:hypothetical protein
MEKHGHKCFGSEYFVDHVHPTLNLHKQLGLWILATLQDADLVGGTAPTEETIEEIGWWIESQIDNDAHGYVI